ncbi:MAG: hypothetical protein ABIB79_03855 [archaeon]
MRFWKIEKQETSPSIVAEVKKQIIEQLPEPRLVDKVSKHCTLPVGEKTLIELEHRGECLLENATKLFDCENEGLRLANEKLIEIEGLLDLDYIKRDFPDACLTRQEIFSTMGTDGYPKIAPVLLDDEWANFQLTVGDSKNGNIRAIKFSPKVFAQFQKGFAPMIKRMRNEVTQSYHQWMISFDYTGVIPSDSRLTINKALNYTMNGSKAFQLVFLGADAEGKWKDQKQLKTQDPLILATRHNNLFILGWFDPTPNEQFVIESMSRNK